jgi:hypothetical protein
MGEELVEEASPGCGVHAARAREHPVEIAERRTVVTQSGERF